MKGEYGISESSMERKPIGYCGKVCFDKRTAQTKKNYLERMGRARHLRIYSCQQCDAWHLSNDDKKARRMR